MRTPIHRFTEKFKRSQLYYLRFRDLLKIDLPEEKHQNLHKLLRTPQGRLINPDTNQTLKHPVSTHVVLHPQTKKRLIDELEWQHENAATVDNLIAEDPRNYQLYISRQYAKGMKKQELQKQGEENMNQWMLQFLEQKNAQRIHDRQKRATHFKLTRFGRGKQYNPYPYQEVRGVINMQVAAIKQCEEEKGVKIL